MEKCCVIDKCLIKYQTGVGSLRDREVVCSASKRQGSIFEICVWRAVSSHNPQEVLLAKFSLHVHESGPKHHSFQLIYQTGVGDRFIIYLVLQRVGIERQRVN